MESIVATQIVGGNPTKRRSETDFYPTPPEVTLALMQFLDLHKGTVIWEPACGEMDMASVIQREGYPCIATDLKYGQDFLTMPLQECDWIITNPPFSLSEQFIRKSAEHNKSFAML
jgi:type I restriction-modification system DNA methylase subunit